MNRKITERARARWCAGRGVSGLTVRSGSAADSRPSRSSRYASASAPKPPPALNRKSRRDEKSGTCRLRFIEGSLSCGELAFVHLVLFGQRAGERRRDARELDVAPWRVRGLDRRADEERRHRDD